MRLPTAGFSMLLFSVLLSAALLAASAKGRVHDSGGRPLSNIHQAEGVELAWGAGVIQSAEVAPIDIEAITGRRFHAHECTPGGCALAKRAYVVLHDGHAAIEALGTQPLLNQSRTDGAIPFIDILENDLKTTFNQRHTAHQIWGRVQVEMPACDIGGSTVRAYVRVRKAELDVAEHTSSQTAAWMMEVVHSDVPLRVIEKEFPSGAASSLVGLIKGGRLRDSQESSSRSRLPEGGSAQPSLLGVFRCRAGRLAATSAVLQAAASMHCCRRRRSSRKMIQSASSSCFRCFTRLRRLTGLTEPPGG